MSHKATDLTGLLFRLRREGTGNENIIALLSQKCLQGTQVISVVEALYEALHGCPPWVALHGTLQMMSQLARISPRSCRGWPHCWWG